MAKVEHAHTDCRALFARLSQYIDNELDAALRRDIEQHVAACRACHVCLETLKRTVAFSRHVETVRMPKNAAANLKRFLQKLL